MARISDKTRDDDWSIGGIRRRDFRHSHDGPERLPHRKRGRGGNWKYCRKAEQPRTPHDYSETRSKWVNVWTRDPETGKSSYLRQERKVNICSRCGKPDPRYRPWWW